VRQYTDYGAGYPRRFTATAPADFGPAPVHLPFSISP